MPAQTGKSAISFTVSARCAARKTFRKQVAAIREYCDRRGIVVTKIVTANGQSGMRPFDSRDGLHVKEVILNDAIDMLVATEAGRLSRDTLDLARLALWMSHHDVKITLVGQGEAPDTCPLMQDCTRRLRCHGVPKDRP